MNREFPSEFDAPEELAALDSGCGPLTAWQVLQYFGRDAAPQEILRACRFDPRVGTYAIGLAVALAQFGLSVEFSTDVDPDPNPVERELYALGAALGVRVTGGVSLTELAPRLSGDSVAVVLFEADPSDRQGHFSPVLKVTDGAPVYLPNEGALLGLTDLEARRRRSKLLRQCVIASLPPAT